MVDPGDSDALSLLRCRCADDWMIAGRYGGASSVVAQAVGVLIQRYSLDEWHALDLLTDTAAQRDTTVEEAAQAFVDEINERGRR